MVRRSLEEFLNSARRSSNLKQQIRIISEMTPQQRRGNKKIRTHEETQLLMKAILKDIKRLEQEGVLEKNGRQWKYHL